MPKFEPTIDNVRKQEQDKEEMSKRVASTKEELDAFAERERMRSLGDRVKRGLDPIGIIALSETNKKVEELAKKIEASPEEVLKMAKAIHGGGPWEYAKQLKEGDDPVAKIWIMLNAINTMEREREMDMTESEFLKDLERINKFLDEANNNPEEFFGKAHKHVLEESQKRFRVEDGVPISEMDNGFVAMATNGYEAGIVQDADGMLFVGAKEIDDSIFRKWNLKPEIRQDRGREVIFFVNEKGEAMIKKLYPGFVIVISRDFDLAKGIVKAILEPEKEEGVDEKALEHKVYQPTSMKEETPEEEKDRMGFIRRREERPLKEGISSGTEMVRLRDRFYQELEFIKSHVIYIDAIENLRRKKVAKGKEITEVDINKTSNKVQEKIEQKMDELKYMMEIIDSEIDRLPEKEYSIMDMAGGAGDLGLAVTMKMLAEGRPLKKTHIIDPVRELAVFNDMIIDYLPMRDEFRKKVEHNNLALQEAEITRDAIVVAKHACGDLTDSIIEQWVDSESPELIMMTCCQDKAASRPARYNIVQEDWEKWCKASSKTNSNNPKKLAEGMEAMDKLDQARVEYLKRHGFEARLEKAQNHGYDFPKGNVIIAKRKNN